MASTPEILDAPAIEPLPRPAHRVAPPRSVRGFLADLRGWLRPSIVATVSTTFGMFALITVQGIILARLLGPQARGEYAAAIFFTQTLTYIGMVGVQFVAARRASIDPAARLPLSRAVMRFGALSGLGTIALVAVLAYATLPADKQFLAPLCVLCALALPAEQMRQLLLAVDQGSGAFRRLNVVQMATSSVLPLLLLFAWMLGVTSIATVAVLSLVAPVAGLLLHLSINNVRPIIAGPASPPVRTLLKEGGPYLLSLAASDLYGRLDAFLFLCLASFTMQGYYAAAIPAAGLLTVGADALALFSFNAASRRGEGLTLHRVLYGGALVIAFQVLTAIVFAVIIGPLIALVYGDKFTGAVPFALALIPASTAFGFVKVAEGHLRGCGKVRIGIVARILSTAVMLTTVWLLFDRLQELSIPLAASVGHGLLAIVLAWSVVAEVRGRRDTGASPVGEALP